MGQSGHVVLAVVGRILRHFVGALLIAWQRAFRAGAIAGLLAVLVVESVSIILTHQFPPSAITHVVAGTLAIALAFGVAATVVADEIIEGLIELIRMLLGEAEAGARQAVRIAEREVGDVRGATLRLTGLDTLMRRLSPREAPNPDLAPDAPRPPVKSRHPYGVSMASLLAALAVRPNHPDVFPARVGAEAASASEESWAVPGAVTDARAGLRTEVGMEGSPLPVPSSPTTPVVADEPATLTGVVIPQSASVPFPAPSSATIPLASELGASGAPTLASPFEADELEIRDALSQTPTVPAGGSEASGIASVDAPYGYGLTAPATVPLDPMPAPPADTLTAAAAPAPAPTDNNAMPVMAAPASGALTEPAEWHMEEPPDGDAMSWHDPAQGSLELEHEESDAGIQPVDAFGALPPGAGAPAPSTEPLPERDQRTAPSTRPLMPRGSIWDHITNVVAGRQVELYPPEDDVFQDGGAKEQPSGET